MVVGSDDGKIRLFSSSTLTMAKTSIPGLGAPITAVDVAYDSKWVLATTNKYLMVVKTQFRDKSGRWVHEAGSVQRGRASAVVGHLVVVDSIRSPRNEPHSLSCANLQGNEWVSGEDGRPGTSTEAAPPQGRGAGQGELHCTRPSVSVPDLKTSHLSSAAPYLQVGRAPLQKGKFTWITEAGRQERWIVASCGAYTVLWNFRSVALPRVADSQRTDQHKSCHQTSERRGNQLSFVCPRCRQVKLAEGAVQSYGGLTTVTDYHLIPRQEDVVDSTFMHDNYASPGSRWGAGRSAWLQGPCGMPACAASHRAWALLRAAGWHFVVYASLLPCCTAMRAWKLARRHTLRTTYI